MNTSGIYMIVNLLNNKYYVGSAVNLRKRWNFHKHKLNKNIHDCRHLQSAWNKDGEQNFKFFVLEYVSKEQLIEQEQYWLDRSKAYERHIGYNVRKIAESNLGFKFSEESRKRISKSKLGIPRSNETKLKVAKTLTGYKHSEETKLKMSLTKLGKKFSDEHKHKMSISMKGVKRSEEAKAKMSKSRLGRKVSEETKVNMRLAHAKRKQSASLKSESAIETVCS